jgi:hypothetical protein
MQNVLINITITALIVVALSSGPVRCSVTGA